MIVNIEEMQKIFLLKVDYKRAIFLKAVELKSGIHSSEFGLCLFQVCTTHLFLEEWIH